MVSLIKFYIISQLFSGTCDISVDRISLNPTTYNSPQASHEHECVAWKTARVSYIEGNVCLEVI